MNVICRLVNFEIFIIFPCYAGIGKLYVKARA